MASTPSFSSALRPFTFTDLAGEIRSQIYRECLLIDRWAMATKPFSWSLSTTILRLNKQIYKEAVTTLWSENDWVILKGDEVLMGALEKKQLNCRKAPQRPSLSEHLVSPVLTLEIDWAYEEGLLSRNYGRLRPTRLLSIFELPSLCRALMDLPLRSLVKACAYIDNRKPKATGIIKHIVNWTQFNTAEFDWNLGDSVIDPKSRIGLFGAKDEVIHLEQGERLDLPWYHGENINAAARMWQHRLQEARGDVWLQRCIHYDQYAFVQKATSLGWFIHEYGPREREQWQRHVLSLGHYVARASLALKDPKHVETFLPQVWRWNALKLDATYALKNHMAESHYLMFRSLSLQGQHIASQVHLVQALMLYHEHAEANEAATHLMRDQSFVGPEERYCFVQNLRQILDPVMWGVPVERSLLLSSENETLPFMNFWFPIGWEVHWYWAAEMRVPFVYLQIRYPQYPPTWIT